MKEGITNIRTWDRALSSEEISILANVSLERPPLSWRIKTRIRKILVRLHLRKQLSYKETILKIGEGKSFAYSPMDEPDKEGWTHYAITWEGREGSGLISKRRIK